MKTQAKGLAIVLSLAVLLGGCAGINSGRTEGSAASGVGPDSGATSGAGAFPEAQDPFGKYAEPVKFTIGMGIDPAEELPEGDTPQNNQYIRYIKDQLNIDVDVTWTASNSDYDQKVSLAISSNSLPDGLLVNDTQFHAMARSQQLEDLTASYDTYASPVMKQMIGSSKGLAIQNVTFDGKMMGLTSVSDGDMLLTWIRKDWMDKLNLKAPTTMADLENIARQFVEKDPGGNGPGNTIGITGPQSGGAMYATFLTSGTNNFGFDSIFNSFGSYPGWWVKDANGNPMYGSVAPETKPALAKLAQLYKDDIIDPEMGIRKDAAEPIISGKSGIFTGGWWMGYYMLPDVIKQNPAANFQAYPIPVSGDGSYAPHASAASYSYAVIRKGYEHPEVAIRLNNLLIRDESTFDTSKGQIGDYPLRIPFGMVDESIVTVNAMKQVLSGEKKPEDFAGEQYIPYKLLKEDLARIKTVKKEPYDDMDIQYWDPKADPSAWARSYSLMVGWGAFVNAKYNPVYSLTYSRTDTIDKRWTNLKKLEDEAFMRIIMNNSPIDAFDSFVSDWKSQGGDQITKEVAELTNQK